MLTYADNVCAYCQAACDNASDAHTHVARCPWNLRSEVFARMVCVCVRARACVCVRVRACVCVRVCVCHTHTRTHTHAHARTHSRTQERFEKVQQERRVRQVPCFLSCLVSCMRAHMVCVCILKNETFRCEHSWHRYRKKRGRPCSTCA